MSWLTLHICQKCIYLVQSEKNVFVWELLPGYCTINYCSSAQLANWMIHLHPEHAHGILMLMWPYLYSQNAIFWENWLFLGLYRVLIQHLLIVIYTSSLISANIFWSPFNGCGHKNILPGNRTECVCIPELKRLTSMLLKLPHCTDQSSGNRFRRCSWYQLWNVGELTWALITRNHLYLSSLIIQQACIKWLVYAKPFSRC